jgi:dipeptidyl aminopeptidase/acylaminoacyl peptidase
MVPFFAPIHRWCLSTLTLCSAATRSLAAPALLVLGACVAAPADADAPASGAASSSDVTVHTYGSLAISPAGDRIASVEGSQSFDSADVPHGAIVIRSARDGRVLRSIDPCAACSYSTPAWSPDNETLAFLAGDAQAGTVQVFIDRGGKDQSLATIQGIANTVRFSSDGRSLALLATVAAKKKIGALEAGAPQVGDIGAAPDEQRIAVLPVAGGELRFASPDDTFVYEYDWMPDGSGFIGTAAKGDGDDNWWLADLDAFDRATGAMRVIAKNDWAKYQMAMPRLSPDGKHAVFVGGIMSDFGPLGGEVYEVPLSGGTPASLTPGFRGSFNALFARGSHLFATGIVVDRAALMSIEPARHEVRTLWSGQVTATAAEGAFSLSADGRAAAGVVEDFGHAPQILAGPIGRMSAITHDNEALNVELETQSVHWQNEGFDVQGWLIGPKARAAHKLYPMIVHVHGGPSAAVLPLFGTDYSLYTTVHEWVQHGYYVFMPNPRGSFGQGDAFARANIRDFGGGDFRDILTGIDAAEKLAPIDERRLGIHGHSYGGFMVMWAVAHTDRFRTAVAGAGLSNWNSYYGLNGIDTWMLPFFGVPMYDAPDLYRRFSPLEDIKQVKTPTLLYTGEFDVEVPAEQSFEFWHALKFVGVPTDLHVYAGEGHLIQQAEHVRDLRRRLPDWFDRYLKP